MTELEARIRRELQNMAQRLAPADPPPLREPPARDSTRRARWMAPVAAMAAVAAVAAGLALVQRPQVMTPVTAGRYHGPADPPLVAVAGMSGRGTSYSIEMMSPRTGRISFVADGAYPAVSPDSRYLAYATGRRFTTLAVRDLRTGRTRVIDVRSLIGSGATFFNQGTISWLGDGTEILAVPGGMVTLDGHTPVAGTASTARSGRAVPSSLRAVVVRVRPGGLLARRIWIRCPRDPSFSVIRGDLSRRQSFLMALEGSPATRTRKQVMGTLTEVSLRGRGVVERTIARLPSQIMPVAIAPDGDRILYLVGHTPPALWAATVSRGRLTGQHRLFTDSPKFEFDQAAW